MGAVAVARLQVLVGLAGPIGVALLLPAPQSQVALISDPDPDVAIGAIAVLLATGVAWALVGWAVLVAVVSIAGRLPGGAGRVARTALASIAPGMVRRIVSTAAGLSVAAGLAACGAVSPTPMTTMPALATPAAVTVAPAAAATAAGPRTFSDTTIVAIGNRAADAAGAAGTANSGAEPSTATRTGDERGLLPTLRWDLDWPVADAKSAPPPTAAPAPASTSVREAVPAAATGTTPGMSPAVTPGTTSAAVAAQESTPTAPTAAARTGRATSQPAHDAGLIVVRPGDSLWTIAAAELPAGSSAAAVDAAWRSLFAANRDVIGDDPDLIVPGQRLHSTSHFHGAVPQAPTSAAHHTDPRSQP